MSDDDYSSSFSIQLVESGHNFRSVFRVEVSGRFIGEKYFRIVDQRPGDGHSLLFAAGELSGCVVQPMPESNSLEGTFDPFFGSFGEGMAIQERHHHVVEGGDPGKQVKRLKHKSDFFIANARELLVVELFNLHSIQEIGPAGRLG